MTLESESSQPLDALSMGSSPNADRKPMWVETHDEPPPPSAPAVPPVGLFEKQTPVSKKDRYYPLVDTLRLYAGWLFAWYFVVFALGSYQLTRSLPFRFSFIDDLFTSPLIVTFAFATFLFLFFSSLHRLFGRGKLLGLGLMIAGVLIVGLFQLNV